MIPRHAFFHARPCALKLTAALHHHRQLADRHLFKNARRSTGGRSGSCSRRIGLRANNDRGRSDRNHDTHNAFKLTRPAPEEAMTPRIVFYPNGPDALRIDRRDQSRAQRIDRVLSPPFLYHQGFRWVFQLKNI